MSLPEIMGRVDSILSTLPERALAASVPKREAPLRIPTNFPSALRAKRDREVGCEDTVRVAKVKLGEMLSEFEGTTRSLEMRLLDGLKKHDRKAIAATEGVLEETRSSTATVESLLSTLDSWHAREFTDEFIAALRDISTDSVRTTDILTLAAKRAPAEEEVRALLALNPRTVKVRSRVRCMCRDPNIVGRIFLGFEDGTVSLLNISGEEAVEEANFSVGVYPVTTLAITQVSGVSVLVTGSKDKTIRVWNIERRDCTDAFVEHTGRVRALIARGHILFSAAYDKNVYCWDLIRGRALHQIGSMNSPIHCMIIIDLPATAGRVSGQMLATGQRSGDIVVCEMDCESNSIDRGGSTYVLHSHTAAVRCIYQFGDFLFSGGEDNTIVQWDLTTMSKVRDFRKHVDSVVDISIGPQNVMFTASQDALILVWNVATGSCIQELHHHYHFVFACLTLPPLGLERREQGEDAPPLGNCLGHFVSGSFDKTIAIWDICEAGAAINEAANARDATVVTEPSGHTIEHCASLDASTQNFESSILSEGQGGAIMEHTHSLTD